MKKKLLWMAAITVVGAGSFTVGFSGLLSLVTGVCKIGASSSQAPGLANSPFVHTSTISADTIRYELSTRWQAHILNDHSNDPQVQASYNELMGMADYIVHQSDSAGDPSDANPAYHHQGAADVPIDAAFALANWAEETQDGATAPPIQGAAGYADQPDWFPGTKDLGAVTASTGSQPGNGYTYAIYPTWKDAIDDWFSQARYYVSLGLTEYDSYVAYYRDGRLDAAHDDVSGYVSNLESITQSLQDYEQSIHPATAAPTPTPTSQPPSSDESIPTPGPGQIEKLANQNTSWENATALVASFPAGRWASLQARQDASSLLTTTTQYTESLKSLGLDNTGNLNCDKNLPGVGVPNLMASAALQLGKYLVLSGDGRFDRWTPNAPSGLFLDVDPNDGSAQCTRFVSSVYQQATGRSIGYFPNGGDWLNKFQGRSGFMEITAGPGSYPIPGDIIVLQDGNAGHVAIAVGVQDPVGNQNGKVLVAQGNATTVLEEWTLFPDGTLKPPWSYWTNVPGYIRVLTGSQAAQRVQPIIQARDQAEYLSTAQFNTYGMSDCAAASLTEVLRSWNVQGITLGSILQEFGSDITPAGGLMNQSAFNRVAGYHGFHADVGWNTFTYDRLVNFVNQQGIPVIIGIKGGGGWGHFLVVTGGDSSQVQVVDSSLWMIHSLPRSVFSGSTWVDAVNDQVWWSGETVVVTPIAGNAQ